MDTKVKIKKYANRRLYDMSRSCYINISDIADMVRSGHVIEVKDAKSGEDLTASTLLQLFLDLENEGKGVLTDQTLMRILLGETQLGTDAINKILSASLANEASINADISIPMPGLGKPAVNKELVELRSAFSQFTKAFRKFDDKD